MKPWLAALALALHAFLRQSLVHSHSATADDACLQSPFGTLMHEVKVSARSRQAVRLPLIADEEYLLVASGIFAFSDTGRQDAMRRWHEPFERGEPLCVSCRLHPKESRVSFAINGQTEVPLRECPFQHVYLYRVTAPGGSLALQINDAKLWGDPFADNEGALTVRVYRALAGDSLFHRDRNGFALEQAVGQPAEELRLGTGHSEVRFSSGGQKAPLRIEIQGVLAAAAGIERDFGYRWDHSQKQRAPAQLIGWNCASIRELAGDPAAHRYLIEASGCKPPLRATILLREEVRGQLRLRSFSGVTSHRP